MTQEQLEFIPILIGIYVVLLTTYWLLKKMPVWFNKPKKIRPISKREKELIKRLIELVDNYDTRFIGLCRTIEMLCYKKSISKKEAKSLMNIINDKFSPLRYGEEKYNGDFWFEPRNKHARINHLNRLLNE